MDGHKSLIQEKPHLSRLIFFLPTFPVSFPNLLSFFPDQAKSGATLPPVPIYAVVTNCTYDGLSIDCRKAEGLLGGVVDRIHFDEVSAQIFGRTRRRECRRYPPLHIFICF